MTVDLLTLADARRAVGLPAAETSKDTDLEFYISAVTPIIEDIVGPIAEQTFTEWHDGGGSGIFLFHPPVLSVTSVTVSGKVLDPSAYSLDTDSGVVESRSGGILTSFGGGSRDVQVVYVAGRTTVPDNITLAARRLLRHLWQQEQQGLRPAMGSAEGTAATPSGFAVPRVVLQLCGQDAQVTGFA